MPGELDYTNNKIPLSFGGVGEVSIQKFQVIIAARTVGVGRGVPDFDWL